MLNFALNEKTKNAVKTSIKRESASGLTPQMAKAVDDLIDAMPDPPANGTITVSVRRNIPLGGYTESLLVEIGFHPADLRV